MALWNKLAKSFEEYQRQADRDRAKAAQIIMALAEKVQTGLDYYMQKTGPGQAQDSGGLLTTDQHKSDKEGIDRLERQLASQQGKNHFDRQKTAADMQKFGGELQTIGGLVKQIKPLAPVGTTIETVGNVVGSLGCDRRDEDSMTETEPKTAQDHRGRARRQRRLWGLVFVVVIIGGSGGAWYAADRSSPQRHGAPSTPGHATIDSRGDVTGLPDIDRAVAPILEGHGLLPSGARPSGGPCQRSSPVVANCGGSFVFRECRARADRAGENSERIAPSRAICFSP